MADDRHVHCGSGVLFLSDTPKHRYRQVRRLRAAAALVAAAAVLVLTGGCNGSGAGSSPGRMPESPSIGAAEADCQQLTAAACYRPAQIQVAYGIQPLLSRGISGRGQTVALQEFAQERGPDRTGEPLPITDIRKDMALFDTVFSLPTARLQVDNTIADAASPWLASGEEVEDAEIVHAVAPDATIRVILIPRQSSAASALAATDSVLHLALSQAAVVSIGPGNNELCYTRAQVANLNSALQEARDHHVTVVSSSGDNGAALLPCSGTDEPVREVPLYASDPLVLSVGGTTLNADRSTGAYISEIAWNSATTGPSRSPASSASGPSSAPASSAGGRSGGIVEEASGGGFSHVFARPAYQDDVPGVGAARGVPDVAADADARTGMTLAASEGAGRYVFFSSSGTSAVGPLWAGLIALADQDAGRDLGFVNAAIYRIGLSASYHRAFHDITEGNNTMTFPDETVTGYQAAPGWDAVTGWGSPNAQALIPLLAHYTSP
jgi:subtilase family serine protease